MRVGKADVPSIPKCYELSENDDGSYCVKRPRWATSDFSLFSQTPRPEGNENVFDLIQRVGIDA